MRNKTATVIIHAENVEITGILHDDWSTKVESRIEVSLTFQTESQNTDFEELKESETALTLTIGKSVFTDQVIQDFVITGDQVKLHTIANREKRPEDFERW